MKALRTILFTIVVLTLLPSAVKSAKGKYDYHLLPFYEYKNLKVVDSVQYNLISGNGKWGLATRDKTVLIEPKYESLDNHILYKGLAYMIADGKNGKYGIINEKDQWIVEPIYDAIFPPVGYFNMVENVVYPMSDGKVGIMRWDGIIVAPIKYDSEADNCHKFNYVLMPNGKGYDLYEISDNRQELIDVVDDYASDGNYFQMFVKKDGKWALVQTQGGLSKYAFTDVKSFVYYTDETPCLFKDGKYYYFNSYPRDGIRIMTEVNNETAIDDYGESYVKVTTRDYYADIDFNIIIDKPFYKAHYFNNGKALVQLNKGDNYSLINTKGEVVEELPFCSLYDNNKPKYPSMSLNSDGLYGLYDRDNNMMLLPCEYSVLTEFKQLPGANEPICAAVKSGSTDVVYFNSKVQKVNYKFNRKSLKLRVEEAGVDDYDNTVYQFVDSNGKSINQYAKFIAATDFSMDDFPGALYPIAAITTDGSEVEYIGTDGSWVEYTPQEPVKYKFVYGNPAAVNIDETE